jgi:hypothetical protein
MRGYSKYENLTLNDAYNFSVNDIYNLNSQHLKTQNQININDEINCFEKIRVKNKKMYYSDEAFYFDKLINQKRLDLADLKFNKFEISCLLNEFVLEIKKRCIDKDDAMKKSGLYRLYCIFLEYKADREKKNKKIRNKNKANLFCENNNSKNLFSDNPTVLSDYENLRLANIKMNEEKLFALGVEKAPEIIITNESPIKSFYEFLEDLIQQFENKNLKYYDDILTAKKILTNFFPYRFKMAYIFGIKMDSRGIEYSETCSTNNKKRKTNVTTIR